MNGLRPALLALSIATAAIGDVLHVPADFPTIQSAVNATMDGDGLIGADDLLLIIADWGMTDSPADISGNGIVDTDDLLLVIASWGVCE